MIPRRVARTLLTTGIVTMWVLALPGVPALAVPVRVLGLLSLDRMQIANWLLEVATVLSVWVTLHLALATLDMLAARGGGIDVVEQFLAGQWLAGAAGLLFLGVWMLPAALLLAAFAGPLPSAAQLSTAALIWVWCVSACPHATAAERSLA
jgi:hypothetical protein